MPFQLKCHDSSIGTAAGWHHCQAVVPDGQVLLQAVEGRKALGSGKEVTEEKQVLLTVGLTVLRVMEPGCPSVHAL